MKLETRFQVLLIFSLILTVSVIVSYHIGTVNAVVSVNTFSPTGMDWLSTAQLTWNADTFLNRSSAGYVGVTGLHTYGSITWTGTSSVFGSASAYPSTMYGNSIVFEGSTPSITGLSTINSHSVSTYYLNSTWTGSTSITTLGTIATGVWHGSQIGNSYLDLSTVSPLAGSISIVTLGTITTGVWNGTKIAYGNTYFADQNLKQTSSPTFTGITSENALFYIDKIAPSSVPEFKMRFASDSGYFERLTVPYYGYNDLTDNAYYDGSNWQRDSTSSASYMYSMGVSQGGYQWNYVATGSGTITWTQLMALSNVGVLTLTNGLIVGGSVSGLTSMLSTTSHLVFFEDSDTTQKIYMYLTGTNPQINPSVTGQGSLGTSSNKWGDIFAVNNHFGDAWFANNASMTEIGNNGVMFKSPQGIPMLQITPQGVQANSYSLSNGWKIVPYGDDLEFVNSNAQVVAWIDSSGVYHVGSP